MGRFAGPESATAIPRREAGLRPRTLYAHNSHKFIGRATDLTWYEYGSEIIPFRAALLQLKVVNKAQVRLRALAQGNGLMNALEVRSHDRTSN
jgi:hypothetical protein